MNGLFYTQILKFDKRSERRATPNSGALASRYPMWQLFSKRCSSPNLIGKCGIRIYYTRPVEAAALRPK